MPILSYLRFALHEDADLQAFEGDLLDMLRLAERQPGYQWAEMGRGLLDPRTFIVVSLWNEVDQVRAWEHHPDHEIVIHRWEDRYREPFVHARYEPWVRPP